MTDRTPTDDFSVPTPELAECAKINFQTVARLVPALSSHGIWMLAMRQLSAVCDRLDGASDV